DPLGQVQPGPVSLAAARRSAAWCAFLEEHARRVFHAAGEGDRGPARDLAKKLADSLPNPFAVRDVIKKGRSGLNDHDAVEQALAILEDHHWVKHEEVPSSAKGGRPTTRYHINPAAMEGKS